MTRRIPWANRPSRCLQPAREVAVAAEQVLLRYVSDPTALDRILNTLEMSTHMALKQLAAPAAGSGSFDPEQPGRAVSSRPQYVHPPRTAEQIREQLAAEEAGRAAVASNRHVGFRDEIADPAAGLERPVAPPKPNANPPRQNPHDMPWL